MCTPLRHEQQGRRGPSGVTSNTNHQPNFLQQTNHPHAIQIPLAVSWKNTLWQKYNTHQISVEHKKTFQCGWKILMRFEKQHGVLMWFPMATITTKWSPRHVFNMKNLTQRLSPGSGQKMPKFTGLNQSYFVFVLAIWPWRQNPLLLGAENCTDCPGRKIDNLWWKMHWRISVWPDIPCGQLLLARLQQSKRRHFDSLTSKANT